jgi:hypothetical protein
VACTPNGDVCRPALHIILSGTAETELQIDDKIGSRRMKQVFDPRCPENIEFFGFVLPNCSFVL